MFKVGDQVLLSRQDDRLYHVLAIAGMYGLVAQVWKRGVKYNLADQDYQWYHIKNFTMPTDKERTNAMTPRKPEKKEKAMEKDMDGYSYNLQAVNQMGASPLAEDISDWISPPQRSEARPSREMRVRFSTSDGRAVAPSERVEAVPTASYAGRTISIEADTHLTTEAIRRISRSLEDSLLRGSPLAVDASPAPIVARAEDVNVLFENGLFEDDEELDDE